MWWAITDITIRAQYITRPTTMPFTCGNHYTRFRPKTGQIQHNPVSAASFTVKRCVSVCSFGDKIPTCRLFCTSQKLIHTGAAEICYVPVVWPLALIGWVVPLWPAAADACVVVLAGGKLLLWTNNHNNFIVLKKKIACIIYLSVIDPLESGVLSV